MINKIPSNSQVIDGFSIIETPYLANKRKFRATTKTDIIRRYEKNDLFGGLKMPKVNYEYHMEPIDPNFRKGTVEIYFENNLDCQKWGVICDTILFREKRIKTTLPSWEYFSKKTMKNVRIFKNSQRCVLLTDHYKFFNIFMIYEMYKARNLFYYQFLCKSMHSISEIRFKNSIFEFESNKEMPKQNNEILQNFYNFNNTIRNFVNSDEILENIGAFLSEELIEQEGSLPLLVPIQRKDRSVVIDEEVVNRFLLFVMDTISRHLDLESFEAGTFNYNTNKFFDLCTHNFYSSSECSPISFSTIVHNNSDSFTQSNFTSNIRESSLSFSESSSCSEEEYQIKKKRKTISERKEGKTEKRKDKIKKLKSDNKQNENEDKFNLEKLTTTFKNSFPLWTKITEMCRFKDFVLNNFEDELRICRHGRSERGDMSRVYYYSISDFDPLYVNPSYEDERDKGSILFEILLDNVQEAFTPIEAKREYDNSILEFLGDGVISVLLAWSLIINNPTSRDSDVDSLRIECSSSKKLFEIMTNDEYRLYEYAGIPIHKTLEYFIPPVIKSKYYLKAKFSDWSSEFYKNVENVKHQTIKITKDEHNLSDVFKNNLSRSNSSTDSESIIPSEGQKDYLLFIQETFQYSSKSNKKEIEKYNRGNNIEYLKPSDLASIFKALIGAIYNCCGIIGAHRVMRKFGIITDECICDNEGMENIKEEESKSIKCYLKILNKFSTLDFSDVKDIEKSARLISETMGYDFINKNILVVAFTHKSRGKLKNRSIWDDYNLLEFLGDSVIKFFNSKRIIKKRHELLKNKANNITDIQRLKFIRTASEKNKLFSFICIKSGIYKFIRHNTKNEDIINEYRQYIDNLDSEDVNFDDLANYHIKMLADVIEAIIGAILLDSRSISKTEKAWSKLFEPYLEKYADDPKIPPKQAFTKYCEKKEYLYDFRDVNQDVETLTSEILFNLYGVEISNSIIKYELKYKGIVVFRRFYASSVKSKDKQFWIDAKKNFKQILVPAFEKSRMYDSQYHRLQEMNKHDVCVKHKNCELKIQRKNGKIKKLDNHPNKNDSYLKNRKKSWDSHILESFNEWLGEYFIYSNYAHLLINDISVVVD